LSHGSPFVRSFLRSDDSFPVIVLLLLVVVVVAGVAVVVDLEL
jgi:predicted ABC-type exoprotein transport system permease subunit